MSTDPMEYQGRSDPFSNVNVLFSNAAALRGDVQDIKETMQQLAVRERDFGPPGPYEQPNIIDVEAIVLGQQEIVDAHRKAADGQIELLGEMADALDALSEDLGFLSGQVRTSNRYLLQIVDTLHDIDLDIKRLNSTVQVAFEHAELMAQKRQEEIMRTLKSPLAVRAKERYNNALVQYRTKNFSLCRKDLLQVIADDTDFYPAWLLMGRLMLHRYKNAAMARVCFRRAADYALHWKEYDWYASAITRWSHLERAVGNLDVAYSVLLDATQRLPKDWHDLDALRYEKVKAFWAIPGNQVKENAMPTAMELAYLMRDHNFDLRADVQKLPLFEQLREFCPWLKADGMGNVLNWIHETAAIFLHVWSKSAPSSATDVLPDKLVVMLRRTCEICRVLRTEYTNSEWEISDQTRWLLDASFEKLLAEYGRSGEVYGSMGEFVPAPHRMRWLTLLWRLHDLAKSPDRVITWNDAELAAIDREIRSITVPASEIGRGAFNKDGLPFLFPKMELSRQYRTWQQLVEAHRAEEEQIARERLDAQLAAERAKRAERERIAHEQRAAAAAERAERARIEAEEAAQQAAERLKREAEEARRRAEHRLAVERAARVREEEFTIDLSGFLSGVLIVAAFVAVVGLVLMLCILWLQS